MLIYNSAFKEDIKILSFFTNYGFKAKPTYIIRDVEGDQRPPLQPVRGVTYEPSHHEESLW